MVGTIVKVLALVAIAAFVQLSHGEPIEPPIMYGGVHESDAEKAKHPQHPDLKKRSNFIAPPSFDAGDNWPNCPSIKLIRNQGACGTCWAVSTASVIADRLCIVTGVSDMTLISGSHVAGCAYPDQTPKQNCQKGGNLGVALKFIQDNGVASGAEYDSHTGCVPYNVGPYAAVDQSCPSICTDSGEGLDSPNHKIVSYWTNSLPTGYNQDDIDKQVNLMQADIYKNGPLVANVYVDKDFENWNDPSTPYNQYQYFRDHINHLVRITGWGVTDGGVSYWIIANSWSTNKGVNGYYFIEMGKNVAGIESYVGAGIVDPNGQQQDPTQGVTDSPTDPPTDPDYPQQGEVFGKIIKK